MPSQRVLDIHYLPIASEIILKNLASSNQYVLFAVHRFKEKPVLLRRSLGFRCQERPSRERRTFPYGRIGMHPVRKDEDGRSIDAGLREVVDCASGSGHMDDPTGSGWWFLVRYCEIEPGEGILHQPIKDVL